MVPDDDTDELNKRLAAFTVPVGANQAKRDELKREARRQAQDAIWHWQEEHARLSRKFSTMVGDARRKAGLTQEALATKVGVSDTYITRLEKPMDAAPSEEFARRLAEVLGLDKEELAKLVRAIKDTEKQQHLAERMKAHIEGNLVTPYRRGEGGMSPSDYIESVRSPFDAAAWITWYVETPRDKKWSGLPDEVREPEVVERYGWEVTDEDVRGEGFTGFPVWVRSPLAWPDYGINAGDHLLIEVGDRRPRAGDLCFVKTPKFSGVRRLAQDLKEYVFALPNGKKERYPIARFRKDGSWMFPIVASRSPVRRVTGS